MSINSYKFILLFVLIFLFYSINVDAYEDIDYSWRSYHKGDNFDNIFQTIYSNDYGFISVGLTNSYNTSGTDIWLVKINDNGSREWHKYFGLEANDIGFSIIKTNGSSYIVAGYLTTETNNQESCILKIIYPR